MSTYGHSLYRPIKISDITSLGFEIDPHESGELCIKIHKDKLTEQLEWSKIFNSVFDFKHEEYEWYYLFLDGVVNHRSNECVWGFTRYNVNTPALDYLLVGLHKLGYKLKVEGERYNYENELWRKEVLKKHQAKSLAQLKNVLP